MDSGERGADGVTVASGTVRRGVGDLLRERRVALGLTQADVANMVKLPARRIEAMECERWGELPDGPYLRGFLRNVAKALDLDPAELLAQVDAAHASAPASPLIAPGATNIALPRRSGPADDRHGGRKLVFGAFAFALVAAVIAWSGTASFERAVASARSMMDATHADASKVASTTAPNENVAAATSGPASATSSTAPAAGTAEDRTAASPTALAALTATSPPAAPEQALRFHFNDQSWVEVRSSDGRVLLHGLNAAGSEQAVQGDPPFALVVGNAKGVELRFRGQPVDLTPYIRDSVARFTLS